MNEDVNNFEVIEKIVKRSYVDVPSVVLEDPPEEARALLLKNTQEAVDRGAFGVPSYYIEPSKKLYIID